MGICLSCAGNGSRPTSGEGISRPVSPGSLSLRANSMGPVLRSRSSGNVLNVSGPVPNQISSMQSPGAGHLGVSPVNNRASFDTTWRGLSHYNNKTSMDTGRQGSPVRTATQVAAGPSAAPVAAPVATAASGGPVTPAGAAVGPPTGMGMNDAEILQQLMTEITRLKSELSLGATGAAPQRR